MPDELFWRAMAIVSPLISAALASLLTLRFGLRKARSDAFLQQRVNHAQVLMAALRTIDHYCMSKITQLEGNEIGPGEPPGNYVARTLLERLSVEAIAAEPFMSKKENELLDKLARELAMAASSEMSSSEGEPLGHRMGRIDLYGAVSVQCNEVRKEMLRDLRDSYGLT